MAPPTVSAAAQALADLQSSVPLGSRLAFIGLYCVFISAWTRGVVGGRRPGWPRLLAALPVLVGNCLVPLLLSAEAEVCTRVGVAFCFVWLCNAKVRLATPVAWPRPALVTGTPLGSPGRGRRPPRTLAPAGGPPPAEAPPLRRDRASAAARRF